MKTFDTVVLGSSGYTGRLVCKHIVDNYHSKGLRWAMAGRDKAKLEEVRASLASPGQDLSDVKIIEADINDQSSLDAMAASAHVVITLVGPYARYGRPVVKACVDNKAHYCDITAEAQFVRRSMDEFDAAAKANGVRIVHSCGFDSVPSEALTLMAAHRMGTQHGAQLGEVTYLVNGLKGALSGGTVESFVGMMKDRIGSADVVKVTSHPYALIPDFPNMSDKQLQELPDGGGKWSSQWSEAAQQHAGPFIMQFHNEKIVRMSNALLGWKYGRNMVYSERMAAETSSGFMASIVMRVGALVTAAAARSEWLRARLPKPGQGGSQEELDAGFFELCCWALPEGAGKIDESTTRVYSKFTGDKDGGYWYTARMLLECGLCMIPENEKLLAEDPYASTCPAGVLAPSAALGLVLHERLRQAGMQLSVEDAPLQSKPLTTDGAGAAAP